MAQPVSPPTGDCMLTRFTGLMKTVVKGNWQRNAFEPWELELLLDIFEHGEEMQRHRNLLARYQKAVEKRLSSHREMPMKLSEYLASLEARRRVRHQSEEETEPSCVSALS